jgi:hypothetical protein
MTMRTSTIPMKFAAAVVLVLVMACVPASPPDTPESRMERALALAEMEIGQGGAYEETLDLGASLATDSALDELVLELGRELTADEELEVESVMRDALAGVLTQEEWRQAAAEIYAEHFTPEELDAALRFYSSPLGAKILGLRSTLEQQMGASVEAIVEQRLEEFIGLVDKGIADLFPDLEQGGDE